MGQMSALDREAFLVDVHVGVFTVAATTAAAPLAVPVWYDYAPDVGVWIITNPASRKGVALRGTGRYGIVAQDEHEPYRYVSVEGPVIETRPCDAARDLLPMAVRYLGADRGRIYTDHWHASGGGDVVYVMRPQRWATADLSDDLAMLAG